MFQCIPDAPINVRHLGSDGNLARRDERQVSREVRIINTEFDGIAAVCELKIHAAIVHPSHADCKEIFARRGYRTPCAEKRAVSYARCTGIGKIYLLI
jgi:hypothetical protein